MAFKKKTKKKEVTEEVTPKIEEPTDVQDEVIEDSFDTLVEGAEIVDFNKEDEANGI